MLKLRTAEEIARGAGGGLRRHASGPRHLAGVAGLLTAPYAAERAGEIVGLYTITRFKGEGHRRATREPHRRPRPRRAASAYVFACAVDERAQQFFERLGFERVGQRRRARREVDRLRPPAAARASACLPAARRRRRRPPCRPEPDDSPRGLRSGAARAAAARRRAGSEPVDEGGLDLPRLRRPGCSRLCAQSPPDRPRRHPDVASHTLAAVGSITRCTPAVSRSLQLVGTYRQRPRARASQRNRLARSPRPSHPPHICPVPGLPDAA